MAGKIGARCWKSEWIAKDHRSVRHGLRVRPHSESFSEAFENIYSSYKFNFELSTIM